MENKVVIAVVGCGGIAQNAHFPAFAQMDNIRIKYACDLIEEKAQKMKEKYLFVENVIVSSILGVFGASFLWSIGELFEQKERVRKGWFPKRPEK